jgi:hypothetical protein
MCPPSSAAQPRPSRLTMGASSTTPHDPFCSDMVPSFECRVLTPLHKMVNLSVLFVPLITSFTLCCSKPLCHHATGLRGSTPQHTCSTGYPPRRSALRVHTLPSMVLPHPMSIFVFSVVLVILTYPLPLHISLLPGPRAVSSLGTLTTTKVIVVLTSPPTTL